MIQATIDFLHLSATKTRRISNKMAALHLLDKYSLYIYTKKKTNVECVEMARNSNI